MIRIVIYLWPCGEMHQPIFRLARCLGSALELVLTRAQEVSALNVLQSPSSATYVQQEKKVQNYLLGHDYRPRTTSTIY